MNYSPERFNSGFRCLRRSLLKVLICHQCSALIKSFMSKIRIKSWPECCFPYAGSGWECHSR